MMETIKRHAFLLGLAAGVVVVSLAVALTVYLVYVAPNADMRGTLSGTRTRAKSLMSGRLFSQDLVKQMADQVEDRKKQHEELLNYIRGLGRQRKPLVDGLFPTSTDISLRHSFKTEYDKALEGFMQRLKATTPKRQAAKGKEPSEDWQKEVDRYRSFTMLVHAKQSFQRPDWIDRQDAPSMEMVRQSQEDVWLMEDIVEILAGMNAEVAKARKVEPKLANVPVKELIEIRVGGEAAVLQDSKMSGIGTRYRVVAATGGKPDEAAELPRAPTQSGRNPKPGFFEILPFRLAVVVEAQYAGELVRRLKGRETFLSCEAWQMKPITDVSFERSNDFMGASREDYGKEGLVRLEVVGESLVFMLPGGRVTALAKAPAAAATAGAKDAATDDEEGAATPVKKDAKKDAKKKP